MTDKRVLGPVRAGANDLAGLPIWTAAYLIASSPSGCPYRAALDADAMGCPAKQRANPASVAVAGMADARRGREPRKESRA
jgi:hypothetical protein